MRYEDLAQDPLQGFRKLYSFLGLKFTSEIEEGIKDRTSQQISDSKYISYLHILQQTKFYLHLFFSLSVTP